MILCLYKIGVSNLFIIIGGLRHFVYNYTIWFVSTSLKPYVDLQVVYILVFVWTTYYINIMFEALEVVLKAIKWPESDCDEINMSHLSAVYHIQIMQTTIGY